MGEMFVAYINDVTLLETYWSLYASLKGATKCFFKDYVAWEIVDS